MGKTKYLYLLVTILGALCIAAGWYLTFHWIDIFTRLRGEEMALSPTSSVYQGWKTPPIPLHFDVYLFNWTNPKDFYVNSPRKPQMQQLGPYRFLEKSDKVNITWHPHNNSLTYRNFATFHFDTEGSNGSLSDIITSVNPVAIELAKQAKNAGFVAASGIQMALSSNNMEISTVKTAEEWIFKGYEDPIINLALFASKIFTFVPSVKDRVGYLYGRNDSSKYDGEMNINTGVDDLRKMGQINTWNGKNRTVYPGVCGVVKGSMGQFFPSNLKPNTTLDMFLPNLCRSVPLEYTETTEIYGVKAFKYAGSYRSIDNGTLYPENKCFCHLNKCELSGTMNVSPCQYNASIRISYPHFYLADPTYLNAVDGLNPDPKKHEFFFALEPTSGLPMHAGGGFQANMLMEPIPNIRQFKNIPKTLIPLMWAEERVLLPETYVESMALVPRIALAGQIVAGVLMAIGLILIFWYPSKFLKKLWRDPKAKSKILSAPDLADTAVQTVVASVAHIKRPFEQMSLMEFRRLTFNGSSSENNCSLVNEESTSQLLRRESVDKKENLTNVAS